MVGVVSPQPGESVLDPTCGTGGFLAEAHCYQQEQALGHRVTGRLVGIDKDHDLFRISSALLEITCGKRTELYNLNSLDKRETGAHDLGDNSFDVVLTNPPFGSKIGVRDRDVLREYDLARSWIERTDNCAWYRTETASATQDPQILFLEMCVRKLKTGGRLGIVLPEGIFGNRRTGYIWHWLRSQGQITSLLDCPRTTFQPGTDTKTNVLFFEKGAKATDHVRIAVALTCGHDRRGRTRTQNGEPYPDDLAALSKNGKGWKKIRLRHPDYLVPRYYEGGAARTELNGKGQHRPFLDLCREFLSGHNGGEPGGSFDIGVVDAMQHHIHGADPQHGGVEVGPVEHAALPESDLISAL